ncbi:hypothetical protein [Tardiphaga sp.]|uniref:hypothetical protein n=1 Tax=Tardiphaga sp. TaxID=1926292 RepID=UPI0037D9DEAE
MKESPNKDAPQSDVVAIVEELYTLFLNAGEGQERSVMELHSHLGSTFHARVLNAARFLKIDEIVT